MQSEANGARVLVVDDEPMVREVVTAYLEREGFKVTCADNGPDALTAIKRLDTQARQLERTAKGPTFEVFVSGERARSSSLDGRSVFGREKDLAKRTRESS